MTFYDLLEQVLTLLQRHHRLSYRALKLQFPLLVVYLVPADNSPAFKTG